jgi:hypothetical protein
MRSLRLKEIVANVNDPDRYWHNAAAATKGLRVALQ